MGFTFRGLLLVVQFSDEAECDKLGLPLEVEELVVFLVLGHFNVPFRGYSSHNNPCNSCDEKKRILVGFPFELAFLLLVVKQE